MSDDDQARGEVHRRFQVWGCQSTPARKYALLVAGYLRTRGPLFVEGEEKCRRFLNDDGRALLEYVEAAADRPLTAAELAYALRRADAAARDALQRVGRSNIPCFGGSEPFEENLRLTFGSPQQAAAQLIRYPTAVPDDEPWCRPSVSYSSVLRVMECLRPAAWEPPTAWTPPTAAVRWARRMYDRRDFTDLPSLADSLEFAGCPERSHLDHLRSHQEHFRGCAALDRLLGL